MLSDGWVKLYRSILDHPLFTQCPDAVLKVFIACLVRANRHPTKWFDGQHQIEIPAGAFIFGQELFAKQCHVSRQKLRTALWWLSKLEIITIKTTNRYSLLIVDKYTAYQLLEGSLNQRSNQRITNGQPTDNQQITTEVEVKKLRREEEQQQAPPLLSQNEWPLTTELVQWRFPSVDSFFVLRLVQDSMQAAISSGLGAEELTDQRLRQIVHESINLDFARPGKTAGLLLKTVPQIIRNRAASYLKHAAQDLG